MSIGNGSLAKTSSALEQRRSAALRAVGGDPAAEFRGGRLTSNGRLVDLASPFLTLDGHDAPAVVRGVGDALAMILRHSDQTVHVENAPEEPLERVIYDVLEQLRCQALAPELVGVRDNLEAASQAWCLNARSTGVSESGVGLLVYTLVHMARARLRLGMTDEAVDSVIETPRARLGRLVGHALKELPAKVDDQRAYGELAGEIARLMNEFAIAGDFIDDLTGSARYQMLVPPDWIDRVEGQGDMDGSGIAISAVALGDRAETLDDLSGYRVFSKEHDVVVRAEDMYSLSRRRRTRTELDELVRAQAVSPHRIARRLRRLFGVLEPDEWSFGVEEGIVDGRRIPQLIANPVAHEIFQRPRHVVRPNTVVSVLMDNSGSMKAQRYETLSVLADTLSRALDLAGVSHEILGHTTASWTGGNSQAAWRAAGRPENPGRVADLYHVIYKDADTSWKRARHSLAAMQLTQHFRESIDGEAVIWAHNRLMTRPEERKILVVVSDGAPAEAATNKANRPGYLADHLNNVVDFIERRSPVLIGALTVDHDVSTIFRRSMPLDLDAALTVGIYGLFEQLFR